MPINDEIILPITERENLVFHVFDDGTARLFLRPQLTLPYLDHVFTKDQARQLAFQLFFNYYDFLRVDRDGNICYILRHDGLIAEVSKDNQEQENNNGQQANDPDHI